MPKSTTRKFGWADSSGTSRPCGIAFCGVLRELRRADESTSSLAARSHLVRELVASEKSASPKPENQPAIFPFRSRSATSAAYFSAEKSALNFARCSACMRSGRPGGSDLSPGQVKPKTCRPPSPSRRRTRCRSRGRRNRCASWKSNRRRCARRRDGQRRCECRGFFRPAECCR